MNNHQTITVLQQTIEHQNQDLTALRDIIQSRDGEIFNLRDVIQARDGEIKQLMAFLLNKDHEIEQLTNTLKRKDQEINELITVITKKDGELSELNKIIASRDCSLQELKTLADGREKELLELREFIEKKDEELRGLTRQIENNVAVMTGALENKDNDLRALVGAIERKDDELRSLSQVVADQEKDIWRLRKMVDDKGGTIHIEDFYPYSYLPKMRYGGKLPGHTLIEPTIARNSTEYRARLSGFLKYKPDFLAISHDEDPQNPEAPCWLNSFLPGLDSIAIYGMMADHKPKTYLEIGSGNSTRFADAARKAHSPQTRILSIDPVPRAEIDQICDQIIRQPLQDCDLSIFDELEPGDILFMDGSHRILQNTDVHVFHFEVLPRLKPGVIIHIHDIYWPSDYPLHIADRLYSEQYMLGQMLLDIPDKLHILLPNAYISKQPALISILDDLWKSSPFQGVSPHGASFWFTLAPG